MIKLVTTTDCGTVAVIKNDPNASKWVQDTGLFFHDPTILHVIKPHIRRGDICVDAGAFIGTHTRMMSDAVEDIGTVLAFEPSLCSYTALAVNCRDCQNVKLFNAALGDSPTHGRIVKQDNAGASYIESQSWDQHFSTPPWNERGMYQECGVSIWTLDSLQLGRLDFIKLDIEGCEPRFIAGAKKTIAHCKPKAMFVEINHGALSRYGFTADDIIKPLCDLGYRMEFVSPGNNLADIQLDVWFKPA